MTLEEWINYDEFWQEAIFQSVTGLVEAQKKESNKTTEEILKAMGSGQESHYVSPMATMPKPSFQMG